MSGDWKDGRCIQVDGPLSRAGTPLEYPQATWTDGLAGVLGYPLALIQWEQGRPRSGIIFLNGFWCRG